MEPDDEPQAKRDSGVRDGIEHHRGRSKNAAADHRADPDRQREGQPEHAQQLAGLRGRADERAGGPHQPTLPGLSRPV